MYSAGLGLIDVALGQSYIFLHNVKLEELNQSQIGWYMKFTFTATLLHFSIVPGQVVQIQVANSTHTPSQLLLQFLE